MWAYHWGAQTKHPDPLGNFPRITPVAFNRDFASTDYYRYIETTDERGLIPVQGGRCLTLGRKVTAAIKNGNPAFLFSLRRNSCLCLRCQEKPAYEPLAAFF